MPDIPRVPKTHSPYVQGRDMGIDLEHLLCQILGIRESVIARAQSWYMQGTKKRYYHTFDHALDVSLEVIRACLDTPMENYREILLAAIYHDAVFEIGDGSELNEQRSADVAIEEIDKLGIDGIDKDRVAKMIRSTKFHFNTVEHDGSWITLDPDVCILMDADIHTFAAPWDLFCPIQESIDAEFLQIADSKTVTEKRDAFLEHVLTLPHIFHTERARRLYGATARENIRRYLDIGKEPEAA